MPQLFTPQADAILRLALVLGVLGLAGTLVLVWALARSDRAWGIGQPLPQPIPFNHAIHAGGLGLDCRYCHATVERAAAAGMPSAELCLGCHAQVWTGAASLAPLRDSIELDLPIAWRSLHALPEHVRFHHAAHVQKGVACATCHGSVWTMARTVKVRPMSMGWCLDCHRDPAPALRLREAVFDRETSAADGADRLPHAADGRGLRPHHGIRSHALTDCTTCHR